MFQVAWGGRDGVGGFGDFNYNKMARIAQYSDQNKQADIKWSLGGLKLIVAHKFTFIFVELFT